MDSPKNAAETLPFLSPQNGQKEKPFKTASPSANEKRQVYSFNLSTSGGVPEANNLETGDNNSTLHNNDNGNETETEEKKKGCRNYIGILLALFAGFVFTVGSIFVKYLKHYHAFTLAMYRLQGIFVPSIFMVLYASKVQKIKVFEPIWPLAEDAKWKTFIGITLRASIGCAALFLHFFALQYLSIADVAVLSSCKPIFVTLAAFFFLGETLGIFPVRMALLTMVGVGVITRPPILTGEEAFDRNTLIGTGFAMCSIVTDTFVVIIIRSLKHIHVSLMMTFLGCWGTIQSTLCAYLIGELRLPESGVDLAYAAGLAVVALLNQVAMNLALQFEQASPVAVTRTMDFIFAFVLQFFVMGIIPDLFSLSDAAIIIACVLLTAFRKWLYMLPKTHVSRKRYWFVLK